MTDTLKDLGITLNQPLYVYQKPMFDITVSTVLIIDNGIVLIKENDIYKFPGGMVKAHQETIQFACVRYIKEQTGIMLKKDALIPVDFRSDPARSKEGNVVDIGFFCIVEGILSSHSLPLNITWKEMDFESRKTAENIRFYMDHEILLERAVEVMTLMK